MRLAPLPYIDPADREALRPKSGDDVVYEGTVYVVEQVGMKYVNMHLKSDPRIKGMAKMNEVYKYFPPEPEEEEEPLKNLVNRGEQ